MQNLKLISSQEVLAKIYSDLAIQDKSREGDVIEWIYEILDMSNILMSVEEKPPLELVISNYRAKLPCDIMYIAGIQYKGNFIVKSNAVGHNAIAKATGNKSGVPTYSVNYPYVFFDMKDTYATLYYIGNKLDSEGYPMLPDNTYFTEACLYYALYKFKIGALITGKSSLQEVQAYQAQAMTTLEKATNMLNFPTVDDFQGIVSRLTTLIPDMNSHRTGFKVTTDSSNLLHEHFFQRVRQRLP